MTNGKKVFKIDRMYDFDAMIETYGPVISSITSNYKNVRTAADAVAEYLSNHHLNAEVIDPEDEEELYDPNVEMSQKHDKSPTCAADLKDLLENYDKTEYVDIHESHVLDASSHNRPIVFTKSELLEKDRGRISFPADPTITNRPDQEVKRVDMKSPTSKKVTISRHANTMSSIPAYRQAKKDANYALTEPSITGFAGMQSIPGMQSKAAVKGNDNLVSEHEGLHFLMNEIERKHGQQTRDDFTKHLYGHIDKDAAEHISDYLYNIGHTYSSLNDSAFKEESIAALRDIAVGNKNRDEDTRRKQFFRNKSPDQIKALDKKLKSSWDNMRRSVEAYSLMKKTESATDSFIHIFDTDPANEPTTITISSNNKPGIKSQKND